MKKKKKIIKKSKKKKVKKPYVPLDNEVKKLKRIEELDGIKNNILKNNFNIWNPPPTFDYKELETNSCFDLHKFISPNDQKIIFNDIKFVKKKPKDEPRQTIIVDLKLDDEQKKIMLSWFYSYTLMYNETIKFIKGYKKGKNDKKIIKSVTMLDSKGKPILNSDGKEKTERKVVDREPINKNEFKCIPSNVEDADFIFHGEEFNLSYRRLDIGHCDVRTYYIYNKKIKIIESSGCDDIAYNTRILSHILDGAIKCACTGVKSCQTNLIRHNIEKYKIRPWKFNRKILTMEVEQVLFKKNTFCSGIFGKIKAFRDGKKFDLNDISDKYKVDCFISYNRELDKFKLYVPTIPITEKKIEKKKRVISLDPGLRTFLTGLSEDEVLKIGNSYNEDKKCFTKIKRFVRKIINVKKNNQVIISKINDKIKQDKKDGKTIKIKNYKKELKKEGFKFLNTKKILKKFHKKVSDSVDDMHWKVIKYLVTRYENILIGDMSTIGIVSGKSKMTQINKLLAYKLKFHQFRQRLEYKCYISRTGYKKVNERFTSKVCSSCGECKEDLGASKVYNCNKCGISMDRDVNGCRGIFLKYGME